MSCHLLKLPDELIVCIVDCLNHHLPTLRQLAQVNAQFQALAEERLYRHIFFRRDVELQRLHAAISLRPSRATAVQSIDLPCQLDAAEFDLFCFRRRVKDGSTNFELVSDVLVKTVNVRELTLESPYCNVVDSIPMWEPTNDATWGRTLRAWFKPITMAAHMSSATQSLQSLKKLTLHLNGVEREFWTASDQYADVFALENLEELHLSSVNIIDTTACHFKARRTKLKRLKLDEANISMKGLRTILAMPRALEHLYLGENVNSPDQADYPPGQEYNTLIDRNPDEFLDILSQHASTLKTLTYIPAITQLDFDHRPNLRLSGPGLSPFLRLEQTTIHSYLSLSSIHQLFFRTPDHAPPNLQSLHITSGFDELIFDPSLTEDVGQNLPIRRLALQTPTTLPSLKTLKFTFDRIDLRPETRHLISIIGRSLMATGTALRDYGVEFEVLQLPPRGRIVAPLLYGETVRPETRMFSNMDRPGRFVANVAGWIGGAAVWRQVVYGDGSEGESEEGGEEWETASEYNGEDDNEGDDDENDEEFGVMNGFQE
ncbi:hypothetical protein Tdes44962_MAKER01130 [Teratosphaeria destructans]|uniref:F-box domain-containing protein n=1 Tax=Teratosphaeria destructans TaxID=418781 RepID=A0A9W7T1R5_9PEZI|nr:hypothetical protein Tdes44962_MAKER01130 [Teratosphaeria destructans]